MVRGDLPPIAATLNNVLKRDAPGGLLSPGRFVLLEYQVPVFLFGTPDLDVQALV